MRNILRLFLIGLIGITVQSCYYDEVVPTFEDPIVIPPGTVITYKTNIAPMFDPSCTNSSCHGGSVSPDLRNTQAAYNSLIGNYVIKNNSDGSKLYVRSVVVKNGGHFGTLNATQLATMKAWIDSDAKYE